jgi:hypothetical protein
MIPAKLLPKVTATAFLNGVGTANYCHGTATKNTNKYRQLTTTANALPVPCPYCQPLAGYRGWQYGSKSQDFQTRRQRNPASAR